MAEIALAIIETPLVELLSLYIPLSLFMLTECGCVTRSEGRGGDRQTVQYDILVVCIRDWEGPATTREMVQATQFLRVDKI